MGVGPREKKGEIGNIQKEKGGVGESTMKGGGGLSGEKFGSGRSATSYLEG